MNNNELDERYMMIRFTIKTLIPIIELMGGRVIQTTVTNNLGDKSEKIVISYPTSEDE